MYLYIYEIVKKKTIFEQIITLMYKDKVKLIILFWSKTCFIFFYNLIYTKSSPISAQTRQLTYCWILLNCVSSFLIK